ncbi:serine/threonine protein phosphatase-like protein 6 [Leptotrombidium deliense]|uniref:Serine/threonine protein phosphatase-like protein 6 n=1 Tax=Leptotrombidium deliense TaxID=299467 RepID=A0A443RZH3_9ACAR|nr:serine/threonine protein phosphatase-like protein 6 [Leptotrombidium deliense]
MTADIFAVRQTDATEKDIDKDATFRMESLLKLKKTDKVPFSAFMTVIANLSFRGTSVLLRSNVKILDFIKYSRVTSKTDVGRINPLMTKKQYRGTCLACKRKVYRLSIFSVRMDYTGRIIDPKNLKETDKKDIKWTKEDPATEQFRQFAVETLFNPSSLPNNILDILRQFDSIQKKRINAASPNVKELSKLDSDQILNAVQLICKRAEDLFAKETRCVRVSSPVYVLGDIHGNIADLLTYERNIWRTAPGVTTCNYLFLGDYVDRGEYGVEVVCYLFALKVLAPERFFLCRGNHEVRSIQKCFTFYKECFTKYGNRVGPVVFEACNRAFDRMPLCAIIDDNIYGAHGGIPTSVTKIDELMKIPTPLQEPETESPAAWEIMWNDPMNSSEFHDLAEFMKVKTDKIRGFLTNSKRGTAFYYSDEAVDNFLKANNLQYILRGHEVMPLGYKFHMNGKVMTVFSSSRYCGGTNEAASIFVDNEEIRVLRFETRGELKE